MAAGKEVVPKKMNMTERRELRKLVEERFDMLATNLRATEAHVAAAIEDRIDAEMEEHVKHADAFVEALCDEARELEEAHRKAMMEIQKKYIDFVREQKKVGIEPDTMFGKQGRRRGRSNYAFENTLESADELSYISWSVVDMDKRVEREMSKVRATKGDVMSRLKEQKNQMLTEIIMGVFQSEEALGLLDKIPTVDNFLRIEKVDDIIEIEG